MYVPGEMLNKMTMNVIIENVRRKLSCQIYTDVSIPIFSVV